MAEKNYTCEDCEQIGGELNAHHIKNYKDYKSLRFKINNSVTLCYECHKEIHKEIRKEQRGRLGIYLPYPCL